MKLKLKLTAPAFLAALFGLAVSCGPVEPDGPDGPDNPDGPDVKETVFEVSPAEFAAKGGTYILPVTLENPVQGTTLKAKVTDGGSWIMTGNPTSDGIPVILFDNLSDARTAQLEVSYGTDARNVTVTQKKWEFPEFDIQISGLGPFGATFNITRKAGYGGGYFFEVLDKDVVVRTAHLVCQFPLPVGPGVYHLLVATVQRFHGRHAAVGITL